MRKILSLLVIGSIQFGLLAPILHLSGNRAAAQRRFGTRGPQDAAGRGLEFRLSEAEEGADKRQTRQPSPSEPLAGPDAEALLGRLPAIKSESEDQTDFRKRAGSLPAPKVGNQVSVRFPSEEQGRTPSPSVKGLEVTRFAPEGEVGLAPDLTVTFSQPMVAVTSQAEAAKTVPLEMTPQVPGRWRWLGTKTLMFDADRRFPMATVFTVRIPAGTRSVNGDVLGKDFVWRFSTPPPSLERFHPADIATRRDQAVFASFDQDIDPEAAVRFIRMSAAGKSLKIRTLGEAELQEVLKTDAAIRSEVQAARAGRFLVFRAVHPDGSTTDALPAASPVTVTVLKGFPSAEGPRTVERERSFGFSTYGAMNFVAAFCGWAPGVRTCRPGDSVRFRFTNAIDAGTFVPSSVKIEPPVPRARIYPAGSEIWISGDLAPRTVYTVTVGAPVVDVFGQSFVRSHSEKFTTTALEPGLYSQGKNLVVLDPALKTPSYSAFTVNINALRVRLHAVVPGDWNAFREYLKTRYFEEARRPKIPGRVVWEGTITTERRPDEMVETKIDLSPALGGGLGHVIVEIEPVGRGRSAFGGEGRVTVWAQATKIGLDAFVDNRELVGFATDLLTGKPLPGVELSIRPEGFKVPEAAPSASASYFGRIWSWIWSFGATDAISGVDPEGEDVATEPVDELRGDVTAASGVLRLPLPKQRSPIQNMLLATRGSDTAFLPESAENFWTEAGDWYERPPVDANRFFVFDDRKVYRPKEEVSVKGYVRTVKGGKFGDVEASDADRKTVTYRAVDSRGNTIAVGDSRINAFGAFDFRFRIPDAANLGDAMIQLGRGPGITEFVHAFKVEEFRRPEFEVEARSETEAPYLVGESATLSVEAKYYAGGGLPDAKVDWTVTASPTVYTPPNRDDFTFGQWTPWWRPFGGGPAEETRKTFKGTTDAGGRHRLRMDFDSAKPARPYSVVYQGAVTDVNGQQWAGTGRMLVHPSRLYVGIRTPRTFVQKGQDIRVESIVTDIDGNPVAQREVAVRASLKDWVFESGVWKQAVIDEQVCTVKSRPDGPEVCVFTAKGGGVYTLGASVSDDQGRPNESELTVWVPGGKSAPDRGISEEAVQVVPDKKEYSPGDVAELLVIAPFAGAEAVLTLRRDGILKTERLSIKGESVTLRIPVEEGYLPNFFAEVDLVGSGPRVNDAGEADPRLEKRPAFASGEVELRVSTASRRLSVKATPESTVLEPGASTRVTVEVVDGQGRPAAGKEVAVAAVDESVLDLTGYSVPDPMGIFYTGRPEGVTDHRSRSLVLLADPRDAGRAGTEGGARTTGAMADAVSARKMMAAPSMAASEMVAGRAEASSPINLRTNFDPLAVFAPSVITDSDGRAVVEVKLPDNLTRYRITAVAVDEAKRFGKGESSLTARKPLMVRPSAPRFMNFGDRIELPVVVQNQTDRDMAVDVAVRATNATLTAGGGRRVLVKANDRAEVSFPVSTERAGTARFQFAASSGKWSDAAEIELPVWTPATTEAFATYGTFDSGPAVFQPVQAPADVFPQFGGLEVTTSSTQLQELTDAFIYLYRYPFDCTEQVASRMISIAALKDVLSAFNSKDMPSREQLAASFKKDVETLKSRQRDDGSFGLWSKRRERYEYPFLTAHVAHALVLAKSKGFDVPEEMIRKTRPYLSDIESRFDENYRMSPQARWTISAYALYVRDLMGDRDAGKAKKLLAEAGVENMPFEALGWTMSVLAGDRDSQEEVQAIRRFLLNRTTETASTANFVTDYGDGAWLVMHSSRRADGVLLEAMLRADARNDLVPKLVRGLLDNRKKGAWSNTQENVFILLALDKYFEAYEKVTPDFVTRVWLGGDYAGEQTFKGRSADSNLLTIPMSYLLDQGGTSNLIIDRQGAGRLYYRIGMKYAPKSLRLEPADYGFTVLRTYEGVDDPADVVKNADGGWTIRAGARVRVKLTMVAPSRRYHVALVDPLPAGLEIMNPALAVTGALPAEKTSGESFGWWRRNWFEHQNLRDERAEAFSSLVWGGVYDYSYIARATTPGVFVVPPAKAEEMYAPETFGRTGTDLVRVE